MQIDINKMETVNFCLPDNDKDFIIKYLREYFLNKPDTVLLDGENIVIGTWLIKISFVDDNTVDVFEIDPDYPDNFKPGIVYCHGLYDRQKEMCESNNLPFLPVAGDKMIALYDDVFEPDKEIYGLRATGSEKMSGFILWTDNSPEDVSKIKYYHIYHLASKLPAVLDFLALPENYRFNVSTKDVVMNEVF